MARARNIKPGFFQNDELGELDPICRLLFIGMWTIADYRGCIEFRAKRIKAQLLPYDNCDIEELSNNLERSGFIAIYSVAGQRYIKITNFEKHQNPHKNERDSGTALPDISEKDNEIKELKEDGSTPDKNGTTRADSLSLIPSSLIPDSLISDSLLPAATAPAKKGGRLVDDWVLPKAWGEWSLAEFPTWTAEVVRSEASKFADFWHAKTGKDATKLDWQATWRNWCRNARVFSPGRVSSGPMTDEARNAANAASDEEAKRILFGTKPKPTGEVIDV